MELPEGLEELIAQGRWPSAFRGERPWVCGDVIAKFAPEERELGLILLPPPFPCVADLSDSDEHEFWNAPMMDPLGLDRARAFVIGDFGIGADAPFVLDYREGRPPPRVMRLRWDPRGREHNAWVEVADSFGTFVRLLGI